MSLLRKILPPRHVCLLIARNLNGTPLRYSSNLGANAHKVNNLEKRFLVWTGKFKTVDEVPQYVASEMMEKARNRMRIRVANLMMAFTLVACLVISLSGKRAHERGESVRKENEAWHNSFKDQPTK